MDLRPSNWLIESIALPLQRARIRRDRCRSMDRLSDHLYIGDLVDARQESRHDELGIETVVTLTASSTATTDIHRPLRDGCNAQTMFDSAASAVVREIGNERKILLHCAAGESRSVAVATAVFALRDDLVIDDALQKVKSGSGDYTGRPTANPDERLMRSASRYVESAGGRCHNIFQLRPPTTIQ